MKKTYGGKRKMTNENCQLNHSQTKSQFFEIVCAKEKVLINLNEVLYIERDARKIRFVTRREEYTTYDSLTSLLSRLPENFIRCHTGYIVNINYVVSIHSNYLIMHNDQQISIGRTYKDAITILR